MTADHYPLPAYKHLPGINARPQDSLLETIASQAHAPTSDASAHSNIAWAYGLRLLAAGYYWESHEVLEAVWLQALPNSREKFLLQGIIHIANAALKSSMQRPAAASRLSALAMGSLSRAYPQAKGSLMGINWDDARKAAEHCVNPDFQVELNI